VKAHADRTCPATCDLLGEHEHDRSHGSFIERRLQTSRFALNQCRGRESNPHAPQRGHLILRTLAGFRDVSG